MHFELCIKKYHKHCKVLLAKNKQKMMSSLITNIKDNAISK